MTQQPTPTDPVATIKKAIRESGQNVKAEDILAALESAGFTISGAGTQPIDNPKLQEDAAMAEPPGAEASGVEGVGEPKEVGVARELFKDPRMHVDDKF